MNDYPFYGWTDGQDVHPTENCYISGKWFVSQSRSGILPEHTLSGWTTIPFMDERTDKMSILRRNVLNCFSHAPKHIRKSCAVFTTGCCIQQQRSGKSWNSEILKQAHRKESFCWIPHAPKLPFQFFSFFFTPPAEHTLPSFINPSTSFGLA